jgi:hypothetical protein
MVKVSHTNEKYAIKLLKEKYSNLLFISMYLVLPLLPYGSVHVLLLTLALLL